jgi:hypothetical protein
MRRLLAASWIVLTACSGGADTAEDAPTCVSAAPPVVADLYCENTGLLTYPETGELTPTLTLWADVEDADGDLTTYSAELFFDDVIDGTVDTSQSFGVTEGLVDTEPCGVPAIILGTTVYLRGGQPLFETTYEWGIVVTDAAGESSALAMVTCATPDESGEGESQ